MHVWELKKLLDRCPDDAEVIEELGDRLVAVETSDRMQSHPIGDSDIGDVTHRNIVRLIFDDDRTAET